MGKLKKILKPSEKKQQQAGSGLENLRYRYGNELSSNDAKTFTAANRKSHRVHCGTQKMRLQDFKADTMLGLGLQHYNKRF